MNTRMNLAFVKPKSFSLSRISAWSWLLLIIAGIFALLTWQHFSAVKSRLSDTQAKLHSVLATQPLKVTKPADQEERFMLPKQEISVIRKTIDQLAIPWDEMFQTFETTQLKTIALLELSPSHQKQVVVIRGEGRDLDAVFAYIRALQRATNLDKVHLQSHYVDKADAEQPVVFTIHARWKVGA